MEPLSNKRKEEILSEINMRKAARISNKEKGFYTIMLLSLANRYISVKKRIGEVHLLEKEFEICSIQWIIFVKKWNFNPARSTKLRKEDFENLLDKKNIRKKIPNNEKNKK